MKRMATLIAVVVMLLGLLSSSARAAFTDIAFNTQTNGILDPVRSFDWANTGSGAVYKSDGTQYTPGTPLAIGDTLTFTYQATLSAFINPGGTAIAGTGLNAGYEITIVASLTETVTSFLTDGSIATAAFATTGGTAKIYYDTTIDANVAAGTGFEDGLKILQGTIQPGTNSTFTFIFATGVGLGATDIEAIINPTFLDTTFFLTPGSHLPFSALHDIDFTGELRFPPTDAGTLCFFCGGDNPFADVASDPAKDFLVDGGNRFTVPEPGSLILLGSGLLGLAGFLKRKSRRVD